MSTCRIARGASAPGSLLVAAPAAVAAGARLLVLVLDLAFALWWRRCLLRLGHRDLGPAQRDGEDHAAAEVLVDGAAGGEARVAHHVGGVAVHRREVPPPAALCAHFERRHEPPAKRNLGVDAIDRRM